VSKHHVSTTINGEPTEFLCDAQLTLLDVLRDQLQLTGSITQSFAPRPAFEAWWASMTTPELSDETCRKIVDGVADEARGRSISELVRERDELLIPAPGVGGEAAPVAPPTVRFRRWTVSLATSTRQAHCGRMPQRGGPRTSWLGNTLRNLRWCSALTCKRCPGRHGMNLKMTSNLTMVGVTNPSKADASRQGAVKWRFDMRGATSNLPLGHTPAGLLSGWLWPPVCDAQRGLQRRQGCVEQRRHDGDGVRHEMRGAVHLLNFHVQEGGHFPRPQLGEADANGQARVTGHVADHRHRPRRRRRQQTRRPA